MKGNVSAATTYSRYSMFIFLNEPITMVPILFIVCLFVLYAFLILPTAPNWPVSVVQLNLIRHFEGPSTKKITFLQ